MGGGAVLHAIEHLGAISPARLGWLTGYVVRMYSAQLMLSVLVASLFFVGFV